MRRYATVEERVRNVRKAGIPYWSFNGLPEAETGDIRTEGFLHLSEGCLSITPEKSICGAYVDKGNFRRGISNLNKRFIPALNKAAEKSFSEKIYTGGTENISHKLLRVHFIYDSISDITHCFALPDVEELSTH